MNIERVGKRLKLSIDVLRVVLIIYMAAISCWGYISMYKSVLFHEMCVEIEPSMVLYKYINVTTPVFLLLLISIVIYYILYLFIFIRHPLKSMTVNEILELIFFGIYHCLAMAAFCVGYIGFLDFGYSEINNLGLKCFLSPIFLVLYLVSILILNMVYSTKYKETVLNQDCVIQEEKCMK